jgi:hypothetical protein
MLAAEQPGNSDSIICNRLAVKIKLRSQQVKEPSLATAWAEQPFLMYSSARCILLTPNQQKGSSTAAA